VGVTEPNLYYISTVTIAPRAAPATTVRDGSATEIVGRAARNAMPRSRIDGLACARRHATEVEHRTTKRRDIIAIRLETNPNYFESRYETSSSRERTASKTRGTLAHSVRSIVGTMTEEDEVTC
jgi:hypothetical protein